MFPSPFDEHFSFELLSEDSAHQEQLPEEELLLFSSWKSEKRRGESILGRIAARRALKKLGISAPAAILRGQRGMPLWPDGICGSITHSHPFAAAVVARQEDVRGVGIDIEPYKTLSRDISSRICSDEERCWVNELPEEQALRTASIFCAKESLYKALYPLSHKYFGFRDAELRIENGVFQAKLLRDLGDAFQCGETFQIGITKSEQFLLAHCVVT